MLESFRGTIDRVGILILRPETEESIRLELPDSLTEFWAVLDQSELPSIRAAFQSGDRRAALWIICERSVSMGSILPRR